LAASDQKEPGVVLSVVLNISSQNLSAIKLRSTSTGDGGCVSVAKLHQLFCAARRVIKRNGLDCRMLLKKFATLRERHWMRVNALNAFYCYAWNNDEAMPDAQEAFAFDRDIVIQKKIVMLDNRSGEAVLNWDNGGIYLSLRERTKDIRRERARQNGCLDIQFSCCFMAE